MEPIAHAQLVGLVHAGHALVGVEPAMARRLLVDSDSEGVQSAIGELLSFERAFVKLTFGSSWLSLLISMGFSVKAFGWWSTLVVPLSFVIWSLYLGRASMGNQRLWPTFSFLSLSILACFLSNADVPFQIWLALVAGAFFLLKVTYFAATRFIRSLVIRNSRAYELLEGRGIHVRLAEQDATL